MKAATILLLAVTVFTGLLQQSSAAPNKDGVFSGVLGDIGSIPGSIVDGAIKGVGGLIKNVLGGLFDLFKLFLEVSIEDMKNIEGMMEEMKEELKLLPEEDKEKVEAATAEVLNLIKDLKAFLVSILQQLINTGKITPETVEKLKALLAKVTEKLIAALKKLNSMIKAFLLKVDAVDVSAVISKIDSIFAKAIKVVLRIASLLQKFLKAVLDKIIKVGAKKTNDYLQKTITVLVENCNTHLANMDKAVEDASANAKDDQKVLIAECKKKLDSIKITIIIIHGDLIEVGISINKEFMIDISSRIVKTTAGVEDLLVSPVFLSLPYELQLILKTNMQKIITTGEIAIEIMKEKSDQ